MSRYSRSSDDGIGDQRFHKKRRLLHDFSASNESLCQFKKANANWNEVLDKSDRRIMSGEIRKYSSGGSDISRSSNNLRRNNYSESHIATPGSSFFCNSDGDSESITSSFQTRPKFHKRETVLQDDFKTALSRDVTLAQDPSFGLGLESNRSCFIADNSGNFASDNSVDNACGLGGVRMKYCRRKLKQHSPKERKEFANILNDVTASEYQGRIVEDNVNEVTNVNLNEVSHFKSNETGFGAQSAITYSTQIVTQTGQFGGMSYVTISEVKERVIIPGRSCPRPMKKGRRESTPSEVNYNDNIDNDYENAYIKSPNSVAEMGIHEEDVVENQSEILSDFEVESDVLNRSGPRPQYNSPLKHSRQVKQRKTKHIISKDLYAELYEDDSIFNSDVNIASSLSIVEMDDSNAYNSTLRSHKAMQNRRNGRLSRSKNESYGSSFNDVSGRSNSRRSILREISQNEFELRSVDEDIQCNDHEVSRYRKVSENSEKLFLSAMDSVKKVHDNVIEERIKKDMSTEVRKMAKKCKESYVESNADSDENFMQELDSVPMIKERRQKRKNRSKIRAQNEFDAVYRDFSISDSIVSVPCAEDRIGFTQMERISAAEKKVSESHDIYRKSRSIAELEEDVQNSVVLPLNGSKNMSMEECENDGKLEMEENLVVNVEKLKRRNSRKKRNGSKEFNLTIENASLPSTAESPSSQSSASFMHENKAVASNSTNSDKITMVEDVTSELALKDKPCSGKMKGNYSKSMLIVDQDTEDYSLHLDQPRSRKIRNPQKVKLIEAEEFNVNLEDVSSNVEESISSTVGVSKQLKMGQKSSVSAGEIQDADTDPLKISEQRARESTLTMKKKISGNTKRSFDQSSSISDDFRVEGDSPVMAIIRPKRRSKQLQSEKGDTFNIHLEEVSAEESFSLVAEASHQPQKASKSSISMSSEIPHTADKQENASKQETEVDSSAIDQQVNDKIDMNIDKSIIIADANLRSATNYPAINIAKEKKVCIELQPLKGDDNDVHQNEESISSEAEAIHRSIVTQEFAVPQNVVSSSRNAELVTSESDVILQSRVTQEYAVPQNAVSLLKSAVSVSSGCDVILQSRVMQESAGLLPESSFGSGNYSKKSIKAIPLVTTEKTSKQETTDDAPPIDQQANDETKRKISKSRVAVDEEMSLDVSSLLNIKSHRRKFQRKSVNGNEFNIVMEDLSLSNAADSITSIAETSQSEKSAKIKKKEPGSIAESEDPSRRKTEVVALAIDQEANNETKRNISKSRVAADEELSLDVNSPPLNVKGRKRKNQRKSVNVNEFNIAVEGLSSSIAADSINSIAEISHSEKSAEVKIPACPAELEDIPRHKANDGIPAVGQEVNDETKENISKSRFILDEELSMDSAVMIVGRRKRRKNKGKSVQSEAFDITVEGVSSLAEASVDSDLAPQVLTSAEELPKASVEPKASFGRRDESVASDIVEHVNEIAKTNISMSSLILDAGIRKEVKSPKRTRKMQKMTNRLMQELQSDGADVLLKDVSLSEKEESNSTNIDSINEPQIAQKCSVSENIVPESVHNSGDSVNKSNVDEASVSIDKAPTISFGSEITSKQDTADDAPPIDQQANDETKRNISKSRVAVDEEMSLDVSSLLNIKSHRRKFQRKSVNGNEFNIVMEDLSLSNAADSITSIAETSQSEKSAKIKKKEPGSIVESEDPSRHKTEEVALAIDQEANNETKRNISKSRVAADEELSLDVNSPPLNVKGRKRKNQRKSVNVNEFNIAMEGLSSSIAADSINSIAEISHSEKSAEDKIPACPAELEDIPRHKANDGIPAVGQEVNDETKENIGKSRFILDEELSMDSAVMMVGRRKRRKNKGKSVQSEAFNIAMGGVSSSTASDSIVSEAEACCQLVMPQKSSEHSHPLLDGCLPDLKKTNVTLQTLVDGKVADDTPVQSDIVNENNHDPPQIDCTLDNSLSLSKISNVLGNDVAESTRGFINSKWLISEYFGDVSRITDDALNAVGGCAVSVVSAHNKSKKSLDFIVNKVETLELPHEALRCKSGGENFSLEGFRNFSLEKQSLDSPERVKSSEHSVSSSSNSIVGKCDVDLIVEEADIAAEEVTEKGELIEVPTEIPSKSELSMSLKSSIHNMEEKIMVSCIADAENLREDASDSRVPMENIEEEQLQKSIDGCDGNSGDNRCLDAKQNENLTAKETTDEEGVDKLRRSPGHSDIEESNVCPSVAVTLISEQVAPHASSHKSTQVEIAAESVENGLTEKVVESPCYLVKDHAAIVKDTCSNQNPEKIADDETSATSNDDAPIPNSTNLISETVVMALEKILIVQPPPKEHTSCTSSTADKAEKLHRTLFHDQSFSKSKDVLTDEVLSMQNSHLEIKSSVEQEGKTYKQIPNSGSSNEETITTSCQSNPTLAPERVSRLPVPIKPKGSLTSKSTPLLKYPPTSSKLVLHASPEEEELPRKLGVLKSIDEETFTILPSKKSSEEPDKLFDEIIKDPCESSHLKVLASDLHDDVHKVSRTVDSENINVAEHTEVPVFRNTESGKLNLSLSFVCLETQGKATTTINELTFIKTAAPGMTSTPLPSMQGFENRRNTEDVSMLSEISELTLDQIATQEQKLDPVTKGNLSVIKSSAAVNELTFIKSTCLKPSNGEEVSQVLCDEEQYKDISDSKKSVSITEPADSSIGKAREITNNSAGANNLRSSLINLLPCSVEPEVEQEEEKGIQPAQELTFTISSALAMLSTSKGIALDNNEGDKVVRVSESVNGIVKSSNSALPAVNNESLEEMVNGTLSELAEVNSGGSVMAVIKPEVHLSVAKSDVQSNVTVADSNISSVNKLLQDATNTCNPSENDIVSNDTQKPVPHSIVCAIPPGSAHTNSKSTSPKTNETLNKQPEQSDIFNELLLLSPLSTSRWNAICHTSDCLTSMISSEVGDSEKITSTGNERFSDPKCTVKSPFKESEVHNSRSAGTAGEHTSNSSGLPYLREADASHLRVSRAKSFELNDPRPSYFSDSDIEFKSTEIGGQKIGTSDCLRNTEGSHLRLSAAVGSKYIHSRPSSSILSERSSLRPSISNPAGWSSITLSSAKESDGDVTRPGLSSHTSEESSAPDPIESLSTPLRTRYRYFSTPKTVERKAVYEVIDRIDASAMKRKKQRDLIFDTIFPKVVPASKEFKKPRILPKPKKVQVEDFDEDEDKEMNHPVKKRRLPVWARNELKTIVTEAIEEQGDHLLDPQEFLLDLVDTIKLVMKSKRLKEVRQGVQKVKQELFNLKLIRTLRDFYQFVRDYLPYEFRRRSIPSSGHYKFNPVWEIEADLDCSLFSSVEGIPNVYHE